MKIPEIGAQTRGPWGLLYRFRVGIPSLLAHFAVAVWARTSFFIERKNISAVHPAPKMRPKSAPENPYLSIIWSFFGGAGCRARGTVGLHGFWGRGQL